VVVFIIFRIYIHTFSLTSVLVAEKKNKAKCIIDVVMTFDNLTEQSSLHECSAICRAPYGLRDANTP